MASFDAGDRNPGTRPATKDSVTGPASANGAVGGGPGSSGSVPGVEGFSMRDQPAVAYVVVPLEDTAPAQGAQQPLRSLVVGPELGQVGARLGGPLLEGRQQAVGVALVPLLRQDHHIDQVGHAAPEPVAQAADPVADLVAEDEVVLVEARRKPAGSSSCSRSSENQAEKSSSCPISRMVSSLMRPNTS